MIDVQILSKGSVVHTVSLSNSHFSAIYESTFREKANSDELLPSPKLIDLIHFFENEIRVAEVERGSLLSPKDINLLAKSICKQLMSGSEILYYILTEGLVPTELRFKVTARGASVA